MKIYTAIIHDSEEKSAKTMSFPDCMSAIYWVESQMDKHFEWSLYPDEDGDTQLYAIWLEKKLEFFVCFAELRN